MRLKTFAFAALLSMCAIVRSSACSCGPPCQGYAVLQTVTIDGVAAEVSEWAPGAVALGAQDYSGHPFSFQVLSTSGQAIHEANYARTGD